MKRTEKTKKTVRVDMSVDELLDLLGIPKDIEKVALHANSPIPTYIYLSRTSTKGVYYTYEEPLDSGKSL